MKKMILSLLTVACAFSLAACSPQVASSPNSDRPQDDTTQSTPSSSSETEQNLSKIFGRVTAIQGNVITIDVMEEQSADNLCPLPPQGDESNVNTPPVLDDPTTAGQDQAGSVAQPVPDDDADSVYLQETGNEKNVTLDEDVRVLYPNGTDASFQTISLQSIVEITLDYTNGRIISVMVIG